MSKRLPAIATFGTELLLWLLPATCFLSAFVLFFNGPDSAIVPHLKLVGSLACAWLGLRLAGTGPASADIALALMAPPAVVDVVGPRLEPGGHARGQGAHADAALLTWDDWLGVVEDPPELWILAAGCSPLAFGERAQARFVKGCLARAAARPEVVGVLLSGWRDLGHTTGLLHADGRPRVAGRRLGELLAAPRDTERR